MWPSILPCLFLIYTFHIKSYSDIIPYNYRSYLSTTSHLPYHPKVYLSIVSSGFKCYLSMISHLPLLINTQIYPGEEGSHYFSIYFLHSFYFHKCDLSIKRILFDRQLQHPLMLLLMSNLTASLSILTLHFTTSAASNPIVCAELFLMWKFTYSLRSRYGERITWIISSSKVNYSNLEKIYIPTLHLKCKSIVRAE